jgi:DNA-binding IclR family transcriptional regulator
MEPATRFEDMVASTGSYQVRALERALEILAAFSLSQPELSLTDLADRTGVAKSTVFRLVSVLADHGYLERVPDTERYRIGIRPFEIGSIYIQSTTVEQQARPHLERLAAECLQTANLGVLNTGEVVHIGVVTPDRPIRFYTSVGDRERATSTGLGKALISEHSEAEIVTLVEQHPFVQRTRRTIMSLDSLRTSMENIRRQGYAIDDEESFVGLRCVAAPIRNDRGRIVAAISVSGPTAEFTETAISRYVEAVKDAAASVSTRLGFAASAGVQGDTTLVAPASATMERAADAP